MNDTMRDSFGREIRYLRISLTDRCDLRCVYCMPAHVTFQPRQNHLTNAEVERVVRIAASIGIERIRLTGGEPLLRPNLVALVESMATISGLKEIAMTTNGTRLEQLAAPLARAGLTRVNISLDTPNTENFAHITRRNKFDAVWRGILAAERAGLTPIKLNAVIVRGYNDADIIDLARLTLDHAWELRFIEVMPFGAVSDFQMNRGVTAQAMQARIEKELGVLESLVWDGHNPARTFRLKNGQGTLGFISSVSTPFCAGCERIRLTADGKLHLCLLRDDEVDLLTPLRHGASNIELCALLTRGVYQKPWGHALAENVHPAQRIMSQIGG